MTESAKSYISRAADIAFRAQTPGIRTTTMGEVAIAKSNLEIADALNAIAAALAPRIEIQDAPVEKGPSDEEVGEPANQAEADLAAIIETVDEESGFCNVFHAEAVLLAREILKTYGKRTGAPVEAQIATAVAVERERIANAFADFFQYQNFGSWKSEEGRYFEDLGNGRKVGYHLAKDVIEGKAAGRIE